MPTIVHMTMSGQSIIAAGPLSCQQIDYHPLRWKRQLPQQSCVSITLPIFMIQCRIEQIFENVRNTHPYWIIAKPIFYVRVSVLSVTQEVG